MKVLTVFLLVCFVKVATSQQAATDLVETARQGKMSELVSLLELSGLNETLKQNGLFTLFAPSNAAFESLPPEVMWRLKSNASYLQEVLKYHVLMGSLPIADLNGRGIPSLQGEVIVIEPEEFNPGKFTVKQNNFDASVDFPNVGASNGVLHVIDRVLMPQNMQDRVSLSELMRSTGQLNTFLDLVEQAGLLDAIRDGGPQTVFAPVDAAFGRTDSSILRQLRRTPRLLKAVIRSHMMPTVVSSKDIQGDSVRTNSLGELVIFRSIGNVKLINKARLIATDIFARNGALHVIDNLLLPSISALGSQGPVPTLSILTKLNNMGLTVFAELIARSNMESYLSTVNSSTVFAPSNKAFAQLPTSTIELLMNDKEALKSVLQYHIAPKKVLTSEFGVDSLLETLAPGKIRVNTYKKPKTSTFTANGIPITLADELAINGVIHVVDTVIPSTTKDIVDVLKSDGRFTTFLSAAQASDLIFTLRSDGPVTVFAPTNTAFNSLPREEFFSALLDLGKLSTTVSNHVTTADSSLQAIFSPGVCWRSFKTLNDVTLTTAMNSAGEIIISSGSGDVAKILQADILATNGVVHVVDSLI